MAEDREITNSEIIKLINEGFDGRVRFFGEYYLETSSNFLIAMSNQPSGLELFSFSDSDGITRGPNAPRQYCITRTDHKSPPLVVFRVAGLARPGNNDEGELCDIYIPTTEPPGRMRLEVYRGGEGIDAPRYIED